MAVTVGDVLLERYVIERVLGEGGMGRVYLGRHALLGMPAALKVLSLSSVPGMAQRFEREAKLMARVRHPNVVAILDYGFLSDGAPCIAMEFADGEPLDQRLRRVGAVHWETALSLMVGVLSGLDAMHSADVLHRDLKPSNIVVTRGRQEQARLIDFGIALPTGAADQRLTQTGAIIGTPAYMAPEQLLCYPMDAGTDVYAAGLIFYEMLTGGPPFPANDLSGVMRRLREVLPRPVPPPHLPAIPQFVVDAVIASLVPEQANRIRTAEEFLGRLQPPQAAGATPASPAPASPARSEQAGPAVSALGRESFATAETMLQAADALPRMTEAQFGTLPTQVFDPQASSMPVHVPAPPPWRPGRDGAGWSRRFETGRCGSGLAGRAEGALPGCRPAPAIPSGTACRTEVPWRSGRHGRSSLHAWRDVLVRRSERREAAFRRRDTGRADCRRSPGTLWGLGSCCVGCGGREIRLLRIGPGRSIAHAGSPDCAHREAVRTGVVWPHHCRPGKTFPDRG